MAEIWMKIDDGMPWIDFGSWDCINVDRGFLGTAGFARPVTWAKLELERRVFVSSGLFLFGRYLGKVLSEWGELEDGRKEVEREKRKSWCGKRTRKRWYMVREIGGAKEENEKMKKITERERERGR